VRICIYAYHTVTCGNSRQHITGVWILFRHVCAKPIIMTITSPSLKPSGDLVCQLSLPSRVLPLFPLPLLLCISLCPSVSFKPSVSHYSNTPPCTPSLCTLPTSLQPSRSPTQPRSLLPFFLLAHQSTHPPSLPASLPPLTSHIPSTVSSCIHPLTPDFFSRPLASSLFLSDFLQGRPALSAFRSHLDPCRSPARRPYLRT